MLQSTAGSGDGQRVSLRRRGGRGTRACTAGRNAHHPQQQQDHERGAQRVALHGSAQPHRAQQLEGQTQGEEHPRQSAARVA